jgi:hypothetical protein
MRDSHGSIVCGTGTVYAPVNICCLGVSVVCGGMYGGVVYGGAVYSAAYVAEITRITSRRRLRGRGILAAQGARRRGASMARGEARDFS